MTKYVAYYRVSTCKQERSGAGLDAQRAAVERFLRAADVVLRSFTEIESGKDNARPMLAAALSECRLTGATLLVAKLDRLSRRLHKITDLMDSDVPFKVADMPEANRPMIHFHGVMADYEGELVSTRTKAALAACKAAGALLGGYRGIPITRENAARGTAVRSAKARARIALLLPVLDELKATGHVTKVALAKALNERQILAPRGGEWTCGQVGRVLAAVA